MADQQAVREQGLFKQGVTTHRYAIRDVSEASPC